MHPFKTSTAITITAVVLLLLGSSIIVYLLSQKGLELEQIAQPDSIATKAPSPSLSPVSPTLQPIQTQVRLTPLPDNQYGIVSNEYISLEVPLTWEVLDCPSNHYIVNQVPEVMGCNRGFSVYRNWMSMSYGPIEGGSVITSMKEAYPVANSPHILSEQYVTTNGYSGYEIRFIHQNPKGGHYLIDENGEWLDYQEEVVYLTVINDQTCFEQEGDDCRHFSVFYSMRNESPDALVKIEGILSSLQFTD
jgi:hypothetical protein